MLIFICFACLYTTDFYNYGYLCIVFFKSSTVKHFEFLKALYKFPIIIIVHLNYPPKWCGLLAVPTGCGCDIAGAIVWNCCQLSTHSVHMIQPTTGEEQVDMTHLCWGLVSRHVSLLCTLRRSLFKTPLRLDRWDSSSADTTACNNKHSNKLLICKARQHKHSYYGKQFSSIQDGVYALRKAYMRSTPSLRSFSNIAFETVPMCVWLRWQPSWTLSSFQGRLSCASPFQASLLQAINGVMSLVVSQVPQINHWLVINWFSILNTQPTVIVISGWRISSNGGKSPLCHRLLCV